MNILFFKDNFLNEKFISISLGEKVTELIFKGIFNKHKIYNGSLFSEYELIGQSNNLLKRKAKPILFLRFGLDGMLSVGQKFLAIFLGYIHVTYEHSHPNKKSFGMLNRTQTWKGFIIILLKNFLSFI